MITPLWSNTGAPSFPQFGWVRRHIFLWIFPTNTSDNLNTIRELPDTTCSVSAIHDWHLDVHYDGIKPLLLNGFNSLCAVSGQAAGMPFDLKSHSEQETSIKCFIDKDDSHDHTESVLEAVWE